VILCGKTDGIVGNREGGRNLQSQQARTPNGEGLTEQVHCAYCEITIAEVLVKFSVLAKPMMLKENEYET
jgi:hypothetical protein